MTPRTAAGHFGSLDHEVPPAYVDRLERELAVTGRTAEIHRYPDAGHVFSDRTHPNYNAIATELMWRRVQDFVHRHLD